MKQHQTLTREIQKLGVDGGDQCEASNPNLSKRMKRSEIKSSLRSQVQDGNKQEDATEPQTAGFKSQVPKEDKVSGDRRPISQPDYSPQSLKVQVDAHSKDSKEDQSRQESPDGQLNEINKLPSAKS